MPAFRSNDEYFHAVEDLIARLKAAGHRQAAEELTDGYRCLNGLTDGWALLLEAVDRVQATYSEGFSRGDQQALEALRAAAHKVVYRR